MIYNTNYNINDNVPHGTELANLVFIFKLLTHARDVHLYLNIITYYSIIIN